MHHQTGVLVLLFICTALLIGAATRHLLKRSHIPYTVALLIIGIAVGLTHRYGFLHGNFELIEHTVRLVVEIDPHLILFIFLPTLIFESAFAMEVHLFRRTLSQIATLAIPGLLVAMLLTAVLVKYTFPWEWSWPIALMFGALISATDPVAVVALLKEMSSRKRLETLLEGESLLNDGTAIVLFVLFFGLATADAASTQIALDSTLFEFIRVILLGILTGLVLGWLAIIWIQGVFNDPLIEITLSIVVAYLAFFIAEDIFHASGVVAVVTIALLFAGQGRSRISPEVSGFLHQFWEMMSYIANTLIFLIVGLIIATRIDFGSTQAWITLFILYIAILFIRTFSIVLFQPILKRIGIGINREKIIVMSWGGLRGAVALALALSVAQHEAIPNEIGNQILFLCAGIVVLTILINGTTMKIVLRYLGLDKLPAAKQATIHKAELLIQENIQQHIPELQNNRFIRHTDWSEIQSLLYQLPGAEEAETENVAEAIPEQELEIAYRRRILESERKTYWLFLQQGVISPEAVAILSESVENALDAYPQLSYRPDLYKHWQTPLLFKWLKSVPLLKNLIWAQQKKYILLAYDIAKGFNNAQQVITAYLDELSPSEEAKEKLRAEIQTNLRTSERILERISEHYPHVATTTDTYIAKNILLHLKRDEIHHLLETGELDVPEAERMINDVEQQMLQLKKTHLLSHHS